MEATPSVLCALGDERQRAFICDQLAADGYPVEPAASRSELQIRARRQPPGVLLLGSVERRHDELALLRAIRADDAVRADIDPAVAVIVLGAEAGELWLPRAFAAGCDDYLACPPTYPELRARIDALARRAGLRAEGPKRHGGLRIDPRRRLATYAGRPLALSALEFALLNQLASDPTRCFTKHELLRDVWHYRAPGRTRTVDAHPCRLRKRLEAAGARGYIANVRGVGYRLAQLAAAGPDDQGRASGDGTGTLVELGVQRRAA
jgi:two-component system, OmpR family, response regulator